MIQTKPAGGWRWNVLMPATFLGLSFLLTLPLWLSRQPRLLGYGSDTAMHLWFFEWFPYAISHGIDPFVTNIATFPQQANLLWNNADLILALLSWPIVRVLGGSVTMGLIYVALLAAAASAMAWRLRPRVHHASAAWVGGLLFGFSPFAQSELAAGHLTWMTTATLPLGWWIAERSVRAVRNRSRRLVWGIACGGWLVLQYWASKELLATSTLMAVVLLVIFFARRSRAALRWIPSAAPLAVAAIATAGVLMVVPLAIQFSSAVPLSRPTVLPPGTNVLDLLAFVVPGYSQLVTLGATGLFAHRFSGVFLETDGYLGLPVAAMAVWAGLAHRANPLVRFGAACAGVAALLALGPRLHVDGNPLPLPLPWILLVHLPFYAKAVPSRMTVFVVAGVACLLAVGWDALISRLQAPGRVAVIGLLFLPLMPSLGLLQGYAGFPMYLPAVFASPQLRGLPRGSVIVTIPRSTRNNHGLTMYWQAESDFRFAQPFGYLLHSGPRGITTFLNAPSPLEDFVTQLTLNLGVNSSVTRQALASAFRRWRIRAVIITPRHGFQSEVDVASPLLGAPPRYISGAAVWMDPK